MYVLIRIAKLAVVGLTMLSAIELITGLARTIPQGSPVWGECHYWSGHLMFLGSLLAFSVSLPAFLARGTAQRRKRYTLRGTGIGFFGFVLILHTTFTGYLGPSRVRNIDPMTRIRFQVIHMVFEPALLIIILALWLFFLWRLERIRE